MRDDWSDQEIRAVLDSYFAMLLLDLERAVYVKARFRDRIRGLLSDRSDKSIDLKWCNVSAILDELGLPWIGGFKPASHYQRRLRTLAVRWLRDHPHLSEYVGYAGEASGSN